ncbi:MAG: TPM domain-containing protein [Candidatus Limivicinus sp.]|jgi:uncharacterized protein
MKKRLFVLLISVLLLGALMVPAFAEGPEFVMDELGVIEDSESLTLLARDIYEKYGVAVCYADCEDLDGMTGQEKVHSLYDERVGAVDGVLLLDCKNADKYYLHYAGNMKNFMESRLQDVIGRYEQAEGFDSGVREYFSAMAEQLEQAGVTPRPAIPETRQLGRIVDEAGVLDAEKLQELTALADSVSEKYQSDVAVVFVSSLNGMTAQDAVDDFYDYNGYGFGENKDGIMLLVAVNDRKFGVTTTGAGIKTYTDYGQKYMDEHYLHYLSDGEWADAAEAFINVSSELLEFEVKNGPYDVDNDGPARVSFMTTVICIILAVGIGFLAVKAMTSKMENVQGKGSAADYVRAGSFNMRYRHDQYMYSRHSRTVKAKSSSDSGGSSTHTSSSGTSHGGHSGSF